MIFNSDIFFTFISIIESLSIAMDFVLIIRSFEKDSAPMFWIIVALMTEIIFLFMMIGLKRYKHEKSKIMDEDGRKSLRRLVLFYDISFSITFDIMPTIMLQHFWIKNVGAELSDGSLVSVISYKTVIYLFILSIFLFITVLGACSCEDGAYSFIVQLVIAVLLVMFPLAIIQRLGDGKDLGGWAILAGIWVIGGLVYILSLIKKDIFTKYEDKTVLTMIVNFLILKWIWGWVEVENLDQYFFGDINEATTTQEV